MGQEVSLEDLLNEHAEALVTGDEAKRQRVRLLSRAMPEARHLLEMAEALHRAYRPVRAPEPFRQQLRRELLHTHRRRQLLGWGKKSTSPFRTYWFWGAVASLLSVAAGGVGYYLHRRFVH
ncbi:MAG: hypothetical protein GXO55_07205 [Chloroflexi bacterium]|nr:hypothetical protein [Chloroflexota bacterium]